MNRGGIIAVALLTVVSMSSACRSCADEPPKGKFIPKYVKLPKEFREKFKADEKREKQNRLLEQITADLNNKLVMPEDVTVELTACGKEGASYHSRNGNHTIKICYELLREVDTMPLDPGGSDYAILSTVYHEVGHALIHLNKLKVPANDEDMVDRFSAWLMTLASKRDKAKYDAAYFELRERKGKAASLHGQHPLNGQRYYNIHCMIYGSDPERFKALATEASLPEERAKSCSEEWMGVNSYWRENLKGLLKEDNDLRISFRRNRRFQVEVAESEPKEPAVVEPGVAGEATTPAAETKADVGPEEKEKTIATPTPTPTPEIKPIREMN